MKKKGVLVGVVALLSVSLGLGCVAGIKAKAAEDSMGEYSVMTYEEYDQLLPVFAALGEQIHTYNSAYDAYRGQFFAKSFAYLVEYMKDVEGIEYTEDENNYYLTVDMATVLAKLGFATGDIGAVRDMAVCGDGIYYDETLERYVIEKIDVAGDYSVKVVEAIERYDSTSSSYDYCDIKAELYKGEEKIDDMVIRLNKFEPTDISYYSVSCANLDNYGIEVLY